jgi:hypothetical protein
MGNAARDLLVPAAAVLVLAACGSSSGSSDTTTSGTASASVPAASVPVTSSGGSSVPASTDQPAEGDSVEIIINVDDPSQVGQTYQVPLGKTVVLRLLSDTDQEYHVHGYDLEQRAAAGVEASFEFTADQAGSFEVESHTTDKVLATLEVS